MVNVWCDAMIEFEIDGQRLSAPEGSMIIEAADAAGIYIPRFCYHRKLSVVANCRMCLVEVSNARKPVPACATPVMQDMVVYTTSPAALESQKQVMQFLLINHPLDCPICDQGGECELQDLAVGYGKDKSVFNEEKRAVASEDVGPLVETWMTRCIHCTRCVRFGEEIAGMRELGVTYRGEHSEIGTYVKHMMKSELSANVIDLCPVGALTAKPSRYTGRAWELKEHPSIASHDCVGSHLYINTRGQEHAPQRVVMRVNPRDADTVNECWISDRDRFSYQGLQHAERVLKPRMKKNGEWVEVEWKYALLAVADRLAAIMQHQSPEQIAGIISPNSTVEESFLMQKLLRQLGSPHVDHRLRTQDAAFKSQAEQGLGCSIAELENKDAILLIGSMLRHDQPMLAHRVRKAVLAGGIVSVINSVDYAFNFDIQHRLIDADVVLQVAQVAKALADAAGETVSELAEIQSSEAARAIAQSLQQAENAQIILGNWAGEHPQAVQLSALVALISKFSNATWGQLINGANGIGAAVAGAVPYQGPAAQAVATGLDAKSLLTTDPVRAYILLNVEPEFDTAYPVEALKTLQAAGCVVSLSAFTTPAMETYADFILPVAPFSENSGTFVNIDHQWQHFSAVTEPHGDAKPAWKILRVLAHFLQLEGFDYANTHAIQSELSDLIDASTKSALAIENLSTIHPLDTSVALTVAMPHMYCVDGLVRRAEALSQCIDVAAKSVQINRHTAEQWQLKDADYVEVTQDDVQWIAPLVIDESIADHVIVLPAALDASMPAAAFKACQLRGVDAPATAEEGEGI
jgi:NADH-quinone oxidoreductase subunit G